MLSRCFLDFSVGVRASVIGLSQISSFSLKKINFQTFYFCYEIVSKLPHFSQFI